MKFRFLLALYVLIYLSSTNLSAQVERWQRLNPEFNIQKTKPIHGNVKALKFHLKNVLVREEQYDKNGRITEKKEYNYPDGKFKWEWSYNYFEESEKYDITIKNYLPNFSIDITFLQDTLLNNIKVIDLSSDPNTTRAYKYINEENLQKYVCYDNGKWLFSIISKYDEYFNETHKVDSWEENDADPEPKHKLSYKYDSNGNILSEKSVGQGLYNYEYLMEYDDNNRLIKVDGKYETGKLLTYQELEYNKQGLISKYRDKSKYSDTTFWHEYEFDKLGNWIKCKTKSTLALFNNSRERTIEYY